MKTKVDMLNDKRKEKKFNASRNAIKRSKDTGIKTQSECKGK